MQGTDAIRQRFEPLANMGLQDDALLVRDKTTGHILVEKHLDVYDPTLYRSLMLHPVQGTPKVEALVEYEGTLTIWETYIQGKTLETRLRESQVFEEQEAVAITAQLLQILDRLHTRPQPIIHRDIKPSNVIVTEQGDVWLIDFNVAKFHSPDRPRDTQLLGTPGYAAPEQYGFGSSGPEADIYAVGVLLNRMLTGNMPEEGITEGSCHGFVRTCLQMDAKGRFSTAAIALKALRKRWSDTSYHVGAHDWFRYLPPGFRTMNPWKMAVALLYYSVSFSFARTIFNDADLQELFSGLGLLAILTLLALFLLPVALGCNYLNVQHFFRIDRIKKPVLRFAAAMLLSYALLELIGVILLLILRVMGVTE